MGLHTDIVRDLDSGNVGVLILVCAGILLCERIATLKNAEVTAHTICLTFSKVCVSIFYSCVDDLSDYYPELFHFIDC